MPQTPPAETAAPAEPRNAEVVGVGDLRMVRTFRVGPAGELFPVNSAIAWTDGWNTATCIRGHDHRPPDADCRCGFYLYSDPAYVLTQPPGRQVIAVVAVHGTMEAGTRGARVEQARIEAVWLGRRVADGLAAAVQRRYPTVSVYRDRAAMAAAHPLTQLEVFTLPRVAERTRRRLRLLMWTFLAAATAVGCVPARTVISTVPGAAAWLGLIAAGLAIVITGLAQRSSVLALQGVGPVGWLITADPITAPGWIMRIVFTLLMARVMLIWWRAATPGRPVRDPRLERAVRRWRGQLPGAR